MILAERTLDFTLLPELEAIAPSEARGLARDQVRLLVSYRSNDRVVHARFRDLPDFLQPGDLLVANDSATLPAALVARRADGTTLPFHLSTALGTNVWVVEPRQIQARPGEVFDLPGDGRATLLKPYQGSSRLWVARLDLPSPLLDYLHAHGKPITYSYVDKSWPIEMYQTIFAREPGSAEMPSAGRAFTSAVLRALKRRGVELETITLHTGVSSLELHEPPFAESYVVSERTAARVNATRARGGRVVAVGTTAVRALETAANQDGLVIPSRGWTELIVTPERGVRVVDGLLTGFHEPRASHLAMLEAIAGRAHLERAYQAALEGHYLWHEFGDLHLILP